MLLIEQDPNLAHVYKDDFDVYAAGDWTISEENGSGSTALIDGAGGRLLVTTGATDNDDRGHQLVGESFAMAQDKPLWFEMSATTGDATECDLLLGIAKLDTTLWTAYVVGLLFGKDDGDRIVDYHCINTTDVTASTGVQITADTFNRYGIYWDGNGTVEFWVDGLLVGASTTFIASEAQAITFAIRSGATGAKTLTLDYIHAVQMR